MKRIVSAYYYEGKEFEIVNFSTEYEDGWKAI